MLCRSIVKHMLPVFTGRVYGTYVSITLGEHYICAEIKQQQCNNGACLTGPRGGTNASLLVFPNRRNMLYAYRVTVSDILL